MIVAIGKDGAIGKAGDLIWHLPGDLKRFKEITMSHPVIMGRKTWDSLPRKPLPGRRNIVISRNKDFNPEGAGKASSPEEALKMAGSEEPFIIGGAEIYRLFLPYATKLYLTEVDAETPDADAFFPDYKNNGKWVRKDEGEWIIREDAPTFRYVTLQKADEGSDNK